LDGVKGGKMPITIAVSKRGHKFDEFVALGSLFFS
jgi:hypothetical protein